MSFVGLDTEFDTRIRALVDAAKRAGLDPSIISGYRSSGDQARAINEVSQRVNGRPASVLDFARGIPGYAAPVGGSKHESGNAVDFKQGPELSWLRENAPAYGVSFPRSLANTDPNHAEVDTKFVGPVQHPDDRRAVEERAAGVEPVAAQPASTALVPVARRMPAPVAAPMPQGQARITLDDYLRQYGPKPEPEKPRGFVDRATDFARDMFTSPLAQAGAALINAGSRGLNPGAGVMAGADAYSAANKAQAEERKQLREAAAEANRAKFWNDLTGPNSAAMAQHLPPGTVDFLRALGPVDGPKVAMDLMMKNQIGALDRAKLEETKRDHDIRARQAEAQFAESQNMNNERRDLMRSQIDMRRHQVEQERQAAERRNRLLSGDEADPAPVPATPPRLQPQSFDGQEPQPQLIQAQAALPPQAPQAQAAPPQTQPSTPVTVDVPGRGKMTADDAVRFGQRLLTDPELRPFGQSIIKQATDARDKAGIGQGARTEVEKTLISNANHLGRLQAIFEGYTPEERAEFLSVKPRLGFELSNSFEKMGGKLSPEQEAKLARYTKFRADTIRNVNIMLKEASGTAVTQQEFERTLMQEANAGTGGWLDIFGGDGHTRFVSKLKASMEASKLAVARSNWLRNAQGLSEADIVAHVRAGTVGQFASLDGMKNVMRREENKIRQDAERKMPGARPEDINAEIGRRMKGMFGI